ncbi:MAG: radical SAM protein [Anaerolineae bacterium]|nr:radical SAM protein [Anaerolineae bacterium]
MSDQKPVVIWSREAAMAEGDCACASADPSRPVLRRLDLADAGEQDCACPDSGVTTGLPLSPPALLWRRAPELYRAPLPGQHEVAFAPSPTAAITLLNGAAGRILDQFAVPRSIDQVAGELPGAAAADARQAALQLAQLGLLCPAEAVETPCAPAPHTLTAWLHVTNQCNLRCAYCYVRHSDEAMSTVTGRTAVEALIRSAVRHGFRAVKLKYAGGEPTLNFALVQLLHRHALALTGQHGLELQGVLLSNGVNLSPATCDTLREMGIRLAISLDGVGAVHDAQRGAGTFERVARSVERAIAVGLRPHLSITVTAQNVEGLPDVVAYALERDLLFNLNFYRPPNGTGGASHLQAENDRLIAGGHAALALIELRMPAHSVVGGLLDRAHLGYPHSYPCGAGRNYVVVDHQGAVSACQMDMARPLGTIWAGDPLEIIRSARGRLQNTPVDDRGECASCVWRYWCAGGCPLLRQRLTGRNDTRSPYCAVYRALLPEMLRLEGIRLLTTRATA